MPGVLQNTGQGKSCFGSESFELVHPCGGKKGPQKDLKNKSKTNENLNVSCTLSEEALGMLFGNENVMKNLFRSKHIASLNEMTFCIMSFLLFLPKTDLKHSRAQYEKSFLFAVIYSSFEHFALSQREPTFISGSFQTTRFLRLKTYRKPDKIEHREQIKSCLLPHTAFS